MSDLISRQAAINALMEILDRPNHAEFLYTDEICRALNHLPSAQPEYNMNEWCTDCTEYDLERHCCPRFNRVIRETVDEVKVNQWIPCSERMPEEDYWLGGSGRQFSDEVLVSVVNCDDEDIWTYISQTIDGEWALELPRHCKIIAWMPLPEPYKGGQ